ARALIVVPTSLQHQWLVEMLRRFNLSFTLLDEMRCQALSGLDSHEESVDFIDDFSDDTEREANSDNPFESAQLILCSLDFLCKNPRRYEQALAAEWDLLLVDEAHHLQWSEEKVSDEYHCIEGLAKIAKGLLLLTATPEQLGLASHFARLRLLDPDRYYDLEKFIAEQKSYEPLNELVQELLAIHTTNPGEIPKNIFLQLQQYLPADTLLELQQEAGKSLGGAIDRAISYLLDRHGTGRVLFRNTRNSVSGFPGRHLFSYSISVEAEQQQELQRLPLEQQLRAEEYWKKITVQDWWLDDPRVEWLSDWLKQHRGEKVLVI